jgi:hypothetical protein
MKVQSTEPKSPLVVVSCSSPWLSPRQTIEYSSEYNASAFRMIRGVSLLSRRKD